MNEACVPVDRLLLNLFRAFILTTRISEWLDSEEASEYFGQHSWQLAFWLCACINLEVGNFETAYSIRLGTCRFAQCLSKTLGDSCLNCYRELLGCFFCLFVFVNSKDEMKICVLYKNIIDYYRNVTWWNFCWMTWIVRILHVETEICLHVNFKQLLQV